MRAAFLLTALTAAACTVTAAPRSRARARLLPEEPLSNLQLLVQRPIYSPPTPRDQDQSGYERDDEASVEPLTPLLVERGEPLLPLLVERGEPAGMMTGEGGAASGPYAVVVMPNRSEGRGGALYAACARLLSGAGAVGAGALGALALRACSLYVSGGGGAGDRGDAPDWRRGLMLLDETEPGLSQRAFDPRFNKPF